MRNVSRQFPGELLLPLQTVALTATAYSYCGEDGQEVAILGPNPITAYAKACELLGDHLRMDLAQEVVVMKASSFKALLALAEIETRPYERPLEAGQPASRADLRPVKKVGRRRRQIFEESQGKCHYCSCELELDGKWHVEHKMPKALGGDDEPTNLVASCVPCNFKKRDKTDIEFKAILAREGA